MHFPGVPTLNLDKQLGSKQRNRPCVGHVFLRYIVTCHMIMIHTEAKPRRGNLFNKINSNKTLTVAVNFGLSFLRTVPKNDTRKFDRLDRTVEGRYNKKSLNYFTPRIYAPSNKISARCIKIKQILYETTAANVELRRSQY